MSRCALLLASLALSVLAPAAAGDVLIAESPCPPTQPALKQLLVGCTGISAHGGRVVWSSYDASAGGFALMTASRGVVTRLAVPARALPFDADLGEDSRGRTVATYSRCAGDPGGPARDCVVRELGFGPGAQEHALLPGVSGDEPLRPSRWGARVAIARRARTGNREAALCRATGPPRCRVLPGGPLGIERERAGPTAIDIDAHRIAMGWFSQRDDTVRDRAILVERFSARKATTIAKVGAGFGGDAAVHSPVLDGGYVYYARGGGSCESQAGSNKVARYDLARRRPDEAPTPSLAALAVDAGTIYYAACGRFPGPPGTAGSSLIERADPPPFDRPGAPDPADATRCPAARPAPGWRTDTIGRPSFAPFTLALLGTPGGAALALWPASGALELAARPAGGSFGPVRRLPGPEPFGPAWTAGDGAGHVVAAWRASIGSSALVQASFGTIDGRLKSPQTLDTDPAHPDLLGIPIAAMAPDGTAVVVWSEPPPPPAGPGSPPGDGALLAAFRAPGSTSFGTPIRLDDGPFLVQLHAIAAADGGRFLVLASGFVQGPHVVAIEGSPAGFSAPVDLGARRGELGQAWAALAPDGAATLAWSAGATIQMVTRPAGGAFGPIGTVSTPRVPAGRLLGFAARGRRVALAWAEQDALRTVARLTVADGSVGAALGRPRALALLRGRVEELSLALGDGGAAALAWRHRCGSGDARVLAATRRSGRFGAVAVVSGRNRSGRLPAIVLGPGARPTVAWVAGPRAPKPAVVRAATPRR